MIFVQAILWILLIVSVVLLIGVILLQEGKGGGLAEAFGGAGAETFGVKAAGINKFTSVVGTVFLAICIALTVFKVKPSDKPIVNTPDLPGFGVPSTPTIRPTPPPPGPKKPADASGGQNSAPAGSNGGKPDGSKPPK